MRSGLSVDAQRVRPGRDCDLPKVASLDSVEHGEVPLGFAVQVGGISELLVHPKGKFALGKMVLHLNLQLRGLENGRCGHGGWRRADTEGGLRTGFHGYSGKSGNSDRLGWSDRWRAHPRK